MGKPITWIHRSRQGELDDLRLEQESVQSQTRKDAWASSEQRNRRINNKMAKQKTYEKRRDECYRNWRPDLENRQPQLSNNSDFTNTLQEIVRENSQENKKEKEREVRLAQHNAIRKCLEEREDEKLEQPHIL